MNMSRRISGVGGPGAAARLAPVLVVAAALFGALPTVEMTVFVSIVAPDCR